MNRPVSNSSSSSNSRQNNICSSIPSAHGPQRPHEVVVARNYLRLPITSAQLLLRLNDLAWIDNRLHSYPISECKLGSRKPRRIFAWRFDGDIVEDDLQRVVLLVERVITGCSHEQPTLSWEREESLHIEAKPLLLSFWARCGGRDKAICAHGGRLGACSQQQCYGPPIATYPLSSSSAQGCTVSGCRSVKSGNRKRSCTGIDRTPTVPEVQLTTASGGTQDVTAINMSGATETLHKTRPGADGMFDLRPPWPFLSSRC